MGVIERGSMSAMNAFVDDFYYESHVCEWFEDNYFIMGFDFIMPFYPGDYIGFIGSEHFVIEAEKTSSQLWLHKEKVLRFFDCVMCFYATEKDKKRIPEMGVWLLEVRPYIEEEISRMRTLSLAKAMGIKNLPT